LALVKKKKETTKPSMSDPLKDVLGKEVELPEVAKEWKETEYAVYHYTPNQ